MLRQYWAALLWAAFILFICGIPVTHIPKVDFWEINIEDKIAHIGVFFVLGLTLVWGYSKGSPSYSLRAMFWIMAIGILYGGLTELLQGTLFPTRYPSFGDLIADSIGSVFGTVFAFFYFKKRSPH